MKFLPALAFFLLGPVFGIEKNKLQSGNTPNDYKVYYPYIDCPRKPRPRHNENLMVVFGCQRVTPENLNTLLPIEQQQIAAHVLDALAGRPNNPLREIVKFYGRPVVLDLGIRRGITVSNFDRVDRVISFFEYASRNSNPIAALYHELMHPVFYDHGFSGWSDEDQAHYLSAPTHVQEDSSRALDEGLATGVAIAFEPVGPGHNYYSVDLLRERTDSEEWEETSWLTQRANEFFVAGIVREYLGTIYPQNASRLLKIVQVLRDHHPVTIQGLIEHLAALSAEDERRARRALETYHAGWDLELGGLELDR